MSILYILLLLEILYHANCFHIYKLKTCIGNYFALYKVSCISYCLQHTYTYRLYVYVCCKQ